MAVKLKNTIQDILGGQLLVRNGGLLRHWAFLLYICGLVLVLISIRFAIKDALLQEVKYTEILHERKIEHAGKFAEVLQRSQKSEIQKALQAQGSTLTAPKDTPKRIPLSDEKERNNS